MDDFESAFVLIKLATDPGAVAKRLETLKAATERAEKAEAALAAAQAKFDANTAAATVALAQERDAVAARALKVHQSEVDLNRTIDDQRQIGRSGFTQQFPGGMVREFPTRAAMEAELGYAPVLVDASLDPHFGGDAGRDPSATELVDHDEHGHRYRGTLTREAPVRKPSPRSPPR